MGGVVRVAGSRRILWIRAEPAGACLLPTRDRSLTVASTDACLSTALGYARS